MRKARELRYMIALGSPGRKCSFVISFLLSEAEQRSLADSSLALLHVRLLLRFEQLSVECADRAVSAQDTAADRNSKRMTSAGGGPRRPRKGASSRLSDPSSGLPRPGRGR